MTNISLRACALVLSEMNYKYKFRMNLSMKYRCIFTFWSFYFICIVCFHFVPNIITVSLRQVLCRFWLPGEYDIKYSKMMQMLVSFGWLWLRNLFFLFAPRGRRFNKHNLSIHVISKKMVLTGGETDDKDSIRVPYFPCEI